MGGWLRFMNLDRASMWVDEVNSAFAARSVIEKGIDALPSGQIYGRARLFTHLVAVSYRIAGDSVTGARLPAAVFGMLSIGMAALLAARLYGKHVAWITLFLMTFSHFEIGWSRVSRMYTLLQFLVVLALYLFVIGFEKSGKSEEDVVIKSRFGILTSLRAQGIQIHCLLLSALVLAVASLQVHLLAAFIIPGIGLYVAGMAVLPLRATDMSLQSRLLNKYTVTSVLLLIVAVLAWMMPGIRGLTLQFLDYTPPWAAGQTSATNPQVLLEFLISPWRFPLAALFFFGVLFHVTRRERSGWILVLVFGVVFILLSLVFTHRTPTYLFFVYPLFLIISAFGLLRIVSGEFSSQQKSSRMKRLTVGLLLFGLLVISPWLRFSLKIPFLPDGITNMAVTPEEWKGACEVLQNFRKPDDVVIASLPQVALYYGVTADYGINWVNLNQALDKKSLDAAGKPVDIYAGLPCIPSLSHLQSLVDKKPAGWILMSAYHLNHSNYIPEAVKTFLNTYFERPATTPQGSVLIYRWNSKEAITGAF